MDRFDLWKSVRKYGTPMKLESESATNYFLGFLQPLRYKNKMYLGAVTTPLGFDNSRKFLLLTGPDTDVSGADGYSESLIVDGKRYSCDHREVEYFGEKAAYSWAVVTLVGEEKENAD